MLGREAVYLCHLSLSESDSILHISFPSVTPTAAVDSVSVLEFGFVIHLRQLVLAVVWACGERKRKKLFLIMKLQ